MANIYYITISNKFYNNVTLKIGIMMEYLPRTTKMEQLCTHKHLKTVIERKINNI